MFSVLTEPNYPKAAIGLEREAVTALALQKEGRGQFGVRQAATIELPTNLLTPSFVERNIASSEELRVLLEEAVVSAGLANQRNWSVSLPSNTARTAILTLDNATTGKGETEEVLDWKADRALELRPASFGLHDKRSRMIVRADPGTSLPRSSFRSSTNTKRSSKASAGPRV